MPTCTYHMLHATHTRLSGRVLQVKLRCIASCIAPSRACLPCPRVHLPSPPPPHAGMLAGKYSMDDPSSLPSGPRGLVFRCASWRCAAGRPAGRRAALGRPGLRRKSATSPCWRSAMSSCSAAAVPVPCNPVDPTHGPPPPPPPTLPPTCLPSRAKTAPAGRCCRGCGRCWS